MAEPLNTPQKKDLPASKAGKRKGEWLYLILLLLLLCSNCAIGWLWWKDKGKLQIITVEKEAVAKDAEIVKQELIALQAQYSNLEVNNKTMQGEIDSKKEEIAALQKQLEKHKDDSYIIARLQRETQTLRDIMQHFVHEIDSLNTYNKNIIAEKEVVKKELKTEKEKTTQLTKEKSDLQNTVNIASMLKTVGLSASGINVKRGGKKEVDTRKAKHTDKIKITFTLAENIVAKKGDRVIYARIVSPDGKELTQADDSSHVFSFGRSHGYWATKKTVNYANENTDVILYAHPKEGEKFIHGKYIIEVNTDGATIGNTTLDLE
ncbi:MAG: coiled-coil domain-containing protein [Bacteroidia bacterium]